MTPLVPRHVVILASAGTGKTFQLTSRCIALLAAGVGPQQILATTFTRLAAGEILRRILSRLAGASMSAEYARRLSEEVGLSGSRALAPEAWRQRLVSLVGVQDRLSVSTLDSFFARLAGGFALELGGALSWQPADEETLKQVQDKAIGRTLRSTDREAMLALIRARASGMFGRSVRAELSRAIEAAHAAVMSTQREAWDRLQVPTPLDDQARRAAIEAVEASAVPMTKAGTAIKLWVEAKARTVEAARMERWEAFACDSLVQRVRDEVPKFARAEFTPELACLYEKLLAHASSHIVRRLVERNLATQELLRQYDRELRAAKSSLGVLAFDDVPRMLLDASLDDRLTTIYYRLDASVSHVLLDEFQDTSVVQWRLIEPLIDEVVSGDGATPAATMLDGQVVEGPARSFFCVGDIKQSLYGWRDAEPDLLPNIAAHWPQVETRHLAVNRRSSAVVIDAVNTVFGSIGTNAAILGSSTSSDAAAGDWWERHFERHRALQTTSGHAVLRTAADGIGAAARRREVLRLVCERVAAIRSAAPWASVGVLFRSKKYIPLLRHMLSSRHGIAASEEGGNPLTDSARVAEVLSLLTLADHPTNRAAAFHVRHSPLASIVGYPLSDTAPALAALGRGIRCAVQQDGLARTIQQWAARLARLCDDRSRERLRRLVWLACEFEESAARRAGRLMEFVQLVESRRVEDPSAAPVRLMSIHASKGLEFDAVVLPDLDATIARRMPEVLTRRRTVDGPIEFASLCVKKDLLALEPQLAALYAEWRARNIREELCALYVGMTRAVHSLEMIVEPRASSQPPLSLAGVLRGALTQGASVESGTPAGVAPNTTLWESGDRDWAGTADGEFDARADTARAGKSTLGEPGEGESALRLDPTLGLDWSRRTRFVPVQTPSQTGDNRAFRASRVSGRGDPDVRVVGVVVHAWLAAIGWIEDPLPSDDALRVLVPSAAKVKQEQVSQLIERFRHALESPVVRGALSRSSAGSSGAERERVWVFRELPFVIPLDHASLSGRFDRVVVTQRLGDEETVGEIHKRVQIYDFKVSVQRPGGGGRGAADDPYREQMKGYEQAARTLFGVQRWSVRSTVIHVDMAGDAGLA